MNIAIIQARMNSSRLPRKVTANVKGYRLIDLIIQRVNCSNLLNEVVVAMTDQPADDELYDYLKSRNINCFRGSEHNVLERFYKAALQYGAKNIIRITSDDPLKDSKIIDKAIRLLIEGGNDYVSNTIIPTFPEGLDIEVFTISALSKAYSEAVLSSEKEHVTPYIWKNPKLFKIENFEHTEDLSTWRWTIDKEEDLQFINTILEPFDDIVNLSYLNVVNHLKSNPKYLEINNHTIRNEGYIKSLREDNENVK